MAYALEPLVQILEQDHSHSILAAKPQLDSLLEKALSLREVLGKISPMDSRSELEILENRIRDAAHDAEDIIESYITGQLLSEFESQPVQNAFELKTLTDVEEKLDSVKAEISKIVESSDSKAHPKPDILPSSSRESDPKSKNKVIGRDEDLEHLQHQLFTKSGSPLQVIPIMGMAGIGKTTIARELYNHSSISEHFDMYAWVTISQQFNSRGTLLALLNGLRKLTNEMHEDSDERLGEYVYKTLFKRRYFIVVDDIWDTYAWDKLRKFFPNNNNDSRIIITTREREVADYANSSIKPHEVRLLREDESWNLLCLRVYGKDSSPPQFQNTGKNIARDCQGLPLAIVVIAGLLSSSDQLEFWELIETNVGAAVAKRGDSRFLEILSLSYNYLPYYLKPCFLYVGAFPEDYEIHSSRMINFWVAEGILQPVESKTLEEIAEVYLKALIDRNLIFVRRQETTGRVRTFGIHDLLRNLCHQKASEEKFFWFEDSEDEKDIEIVRRVRVHPSSQLTDKMESISHARSFVCIRHATLELADSFLALKLLRVLDVFDLEFFQFPSEMMQLVNLRYLAFSSYSDLPVEITRFRYLRTLIIRRLPSFRAFSLPSELWEMGQLRQIKSKETCVWYFPTDDETFHLENLQTLSNILSSGMTNAVLERFPNLRKLGLCCNDSMPDVIYLGLLKKLEILKCTTDWSIASHEFLFSLTLPDSLKKLTLSLCKIPKVFMEIVGSLPNLEYLKLQKSDFLGPNGETTEVEWETSEPEWVLEDGEGFQKLTSLVMDDLNLVNLIADDTSFPGLQSLVIRDCCSMKEIPLDIGNTPTLELIEVDESSPWVLASVKEMQKQQKELENHSLKFVFYSAF